MLIFVVGAFDASNHSPTIHLKKIRQNLPPKSPNHRQTGNCLKTQEEKKLPLLRDDVFVCKYFQLPGAPWGTACDITNMTFQVRGENKRVEVEGFFGVSNKKKANNMANQIKKKRKGGVYIYIRVYINIYIYVFISINIITVATREGFGWWQSTCWDVKR